MAKSKILIIGATGYIGRHITNASLSLGHPTFVLVRESSDASKAQLIDSFKASGATILYGSLEDQQSLVSAVSQVDVVISAVGSLLIEKQVNLIAAIKEAGTVKRFLPSEFGLDVDRELSTPLLNTILGGKKKIRRAIEEAGIAYTYISSNSFAGYFLSNLGDLAHTKPPKDKITIYGDGNTKVVFVTEEDVGTYTIKSVDSDEAFNKTVYIKPPANILSQNEIVEIWEKKIGKKLEKVFLSEEEIVKQIEESPFPHKIQLAFRHSIFVRGDEIFDIGPHGVEASQLFPDVKYTTVEAYLDRFL